MSEKKKPGQRPDARKRGVLALLSSRDNSDVLGSYTGTPKDGLEPVQDADDL